MTLDFYCERLNRGVEFHGAIHGRLKKEKREENDKRKRELLAEQGIKTLWVAEPDTKDMPMLIERLAQLIFQSIIRHHREVKTMIDTVDTEEKAATYTELEMCRTLRISVERLHKGIAEGRYTYTERHEIQEKVNRRGARFRRFAGVRYSFNQLDYNHNIRAYRNALTS